MALARTSVLSRPARLATAAQISSKAASASLRRKAGAGQTQSRCNSSSTAVMELQSSAPHEQLVKALQGIIPSLTCE
jgi:hypothetical protein